MQQTMRDRKVRPTVTAKVGLLTLYDHDIGTAPTLFRRLEDQFDRALELFLVLLQQLRCSKQHCDVPIMACPVTPDERAGHFPTLLLLTDLASRVRQHTCRTYTSLQSRSVCAGVLQSCTPSMIKQISINPNAKSQVLCISQHNCCQQSAISSLRNMVHGLLGCMTLFHKAASAAA